MLVLSERSEARIGSWLSPVMPASGREHFSARWPDAETVATVRAQL